MAEDKGKPKKVKIHYKKNPLYRTIFADGAAGGITPRNMVNLSFYATRKAIPKTIEYDLTENNTLTNPTVADSITGIVREIEFSVYLDKRAATELLGFLQKILNKNDK